MESERRARLISAEGKKMANAATELRDAKRMFKERQSKREAANSQLHEAAFRGDTNRVRRLATRENCNSRGGYKTLNFKDKTPLFAAAMAARDSGCGSARVLLRLGADVGLKDDKGRAALHWAVLCDNHRMVRILVANGADVNARDADGESAIFMANLENRAMLAVLMQAGCNFRATNSREQTPEELAADWGERATQVVTEELKRSELEERRHECVEHLCSAALTANSERLSSLLDENGSACCDFASRQRRITPLMALARALNASDSACAVCTQLLVEHGANVNTQDRLGWSAVHHAAAYGSAAAVKALAGAKADLNLLSDDGETPMTLAVKWSREQALRELLAANADEKATDGDGRTPRQLARTLGSCEGVLLNALSSSARTDTRVTSLSSINEFGSDNDVFGSSLLSEPPVSVEETEASMSQGICLVINIKDYECSSGLEVRSGSERDVERLRRCFEELRFEFEVRQHLKGFEIFWLLASYARMSHGARRSFVCFLMAHGSDGAIYGRDGGHQLVSDLVSLFESNKCWSLKGRPKIFFVQACRKQSPQWVPQETPRDTTVPNAGAAAGGHPRRDFLVCHATSRFSPAFRLSNEGSPFIEELCRVINASPGDPLNSQLERVNGILNDKIITDVEGRSYVVSIEWSSQMTSSFQFWPD